MTSQILRVALDVPVDSLFDYQNNGPKAQIGARVVVSFSGRQLVGIIVEIADTSSVAHDKLKPVIAVFDEVVFDAATFRLLRFCADYYHHPLGQVLLSALPLRLRQIKPAKARQTFVYALKPASPLPAIPKRQIVLQRVLSALQNAQSLSESELATITSSWRKPIAFLQAQGCITQSAVILHKPNITASQEAPTLNAEQQQAINAILAVKNQFRAWLLYGITGSGKTEVYIQVMNEVLRAPKAQILILVPEINLTPQLEARFQSRLSQYTMVSLHSNLSESERLQHWQMASSSAAQIVIGTRLSVLTPLPHLAMIIIDEEHDGSYKQQDGMRYHARDVALMRAKQRNIPVVMGSATPSLEVWRLANQSAGTPMATPQPAYGLLRLTTRAVKAAQLANIQCIDIAKSPTENGLSPLLVQALRQRLKRGEQSLLFINRRGYAPVLHCRACLWVAPCLRCSAKLVLHLQQRRLKCHHCGHEQRIPLQCPSCGNPDLTPVGQATQRLEHTLSQLLPDARIARVDRDTVRTKDALTDLLIRVQNQTIDILVGTQMLAKGHDFPHLTLVGIIDTDTALFSPDFRANERLFAQLMQVAGRAGRAEKAGEVLIQTAFPTHALFNALRQQDYPSYAYTLLQERALMQFPPMYFFSLLKAEAQQLDLVLTFLNQAARLARSLTEEVTIYDPVRPQMERLNNMERGQLMFHAASRISMQRLFRQLIPQLRAIKANNKIRWALDIDPLDF